MMIGVQAGDRVEMTQRERDVLKVMAGVLAGSRTQVEASRLLKLSVRHIRRLQQQLEARGDASLAHGLRGKPSNHRHEPGFRKKVLTLYRKKYADFGPTFACEKFAEEKLQVGVETLRQWLIAEGLWQRKRRRDPHRSRRPRRSCLGELVQMDASIHNWLEGRGQTLVLITMIDDATGQLMAKFYRHGTVEAHMDLLGIWLRKRGRPLALYTDRHSIFEPHEKGQALADPDTETQFGRALRELDIELIRAHSPQAKGRVERSQPGQPALGAIQRQVVEVLIGNDLSQESGTGQALVDGLRRLGSLAHLALAARTGILHLLVFDDEHLSRLVVVLFAGLDADLASLLAAFGAGSFRLGQLVTPLFATQMRGRLPSAVRLALAASARWVVRPWWRAWSRRRLR